MNTTPAFNTTPALNTAPALSGSAAGHDRTDHPASQLLKSQEVSTKVALLMQERTTTALTQINERIREAWQHHAAGTPPQPVAPWDLWASGTQYAVDFAQRSLIFWDTLRQRGNNFIEHERQGLPPVLHFEHEMVMDGRALAAAGQLRAAAHRAARGHGGRRPSAGRT